MNLAPSAAHSAGPTVDSTRIRRPHVGGRTSPGAPLSQTEIATARHLAEQAARRLDGDPLPTILDGVNRTPRKTVIPDLFQTIGIIPGKQDRNRDLFLMLPPPIVRSSLISTSPLGRGSRLGRSQQRGGGPFCS